jgi:hypothetical protein
MRVAWGWLGGGYGWLQSAIPHSALLNRFLALLNELGSRFCVIGGQGVNGYVEPLVSLDLDAVVAAGQLPELEKRAEREFKLQRFPHSLNLSAPGSDL